MIRILLAFAAGAALAALAFIARPLVTSPPNSVHVSDAAIHAAAALREQMAPHITDLMTGDISTRRSILDQYFYAPRIEVARQLYAVHEEPLEIEGVYTEVFVPAEGIPPHNADRVLINLHGGGFSVGARTEGPRLLLIDASTRVSFGHKAEVIGLNLKVSFLVSCRSKLVDQLLLPAQSGRSISLDKFCSSISYYDLPRL